MVHLMLTVLPLVNLSLKAQLKIQSKVTRMSIQKLRKRSSSIKMTRRKLSNKKVGVQVEEGVLVVRKVVNKKVKENLGHSMLTEHQLGSLYLKELLRIQFINIRKLVALKEKSNERVEVASLVKSNKEAENSLLVNKNSKKNCLLKDNSKEEKARHKKVQERKKILNFSLKVGRKTKGSMDLSMSIAHPLDNLSLKVLSKSLLKNTLMLKPKLNKR
jgi:hypothetical protein